MPWTQARRDYLVVTTRSERAFPKLASLIRKIERWWIVHVDVPTNPEFDGKDVDEESVTSGPEIAMSVLWDLAMGDERSSVLL